MLGKIEGKRRRRWQRIRWLDSITDSMDMNLSKLQEMVKDKEARRAASTGLQRVNSLEKTLMLGKTEGRRKRGWQRIRWLDSITDSTDMNLGKL